jgi:hypothetical protein
MLGEHIYRLIERGLWALAPALVLLMLFNLPAIWAAREQAAQSAAEEIAAENDRYCEKWGLPSGTPKHDACVRDLVNIRARSALQAYDEQADWL